METQSTLALELPAEPSAAVPMTSSAVFSEDRRYRFELWRRWAPGPYAMFIGLNPSTADETMDDPTIRRCIGFARAWGYSALCMTNLFAFRATDPAVMKQQQDAAVGGSKNDLTLVALARSAGIVIAAWGVHGVHLDREEEVKKLIPNLQCLGCTQDGHPRHPLYLRKDAVTMPFPPPSRPPVARRPLTEDERKAVDCLRQCTFPVASWDKRFARGMQGVLEITDKEAAQVWRLFKRYRRQITHADKAALLVLAEQRAAPDARQKTREWLDQRRLKEHQKQHA